MYELVVEIKRVKKKLDKYLKQRKDISLKLKRLCFNPRYELGAHKLHGELREKWSCWLGGNLRIIYVIDDENKVIRVEKIGPHNIY